jgi:hypothetical protein
VVDIGRMDKGVFFLADVDKSSFHARKHVTDFAFIDAAEGSFAVQISVEIDLNELSVFKDGYALFFVANIN